MQLQHMRMLNQFQNGNLPLNLVRDKKGRRQKGTERRKDTSAGAGVRTVQTLVKTGSNVELMHDRRHLDGSQ